MGLSLILAVISTLDLHPEFPLVLINICKTEIFDKIFVTKVQ